MRNIVLALAFVVLCIGLTGCGMPKIGSIRDQNTTQADAIPELSNVIKIENDKIVPSQAIIQIGEGVIFLNLDSKTHRIVSDPHPEHSLLLDLDSELMYKNEKYEYIFQNAGQWGYHLEDNPSIKGKVIVE